ncbi:MAG: SIS domain-containing protein [Candidatus Acidiferrum sp.]|jgi:glucosamine--fructose-6-phosphate aminotransferase (isomerizing)
MLMKPTEYAQSETYKEILSQGAVWQSALLQLKASNFGKKMLGSNNRKASLLFVGCGTSFYLADAAATSWTLLTGEPARAVPASEILLYPSLTRAAAGDLQAVVISRSGRTSETVRAAHVLRKGILIPTWGITCAEKSELQAECDSTLVLSAADEKSTVMTRSFTSMLISLQWLAATHAGNAEFCNSLEVMAAQFDTRIRYLAEQLENFTARLSFEDYIFLGQGPFHGIAREAALKVMEMSCSYSQSFHTLEFRHGPKAIVTPRTALTFFVSQAGQQAEVEVLEEMKDLHGVTIAICNKADESIRRSSDLVLELDLPGDELSLLAPHIVPSQLMGFFTGVAKGLNPDLPKNLTRVVVLD